MALKLACENERQLPNPVLWMEERIKDFTKAIFDKNHRAAHLSALQRESVKRQTSLDRTLQFWTRSAAIYSTYKACQLRVLFVKDEEEKERIWEEQHERAADKLYNLCYDLKGSFIKTAQAIAKPDLSPMAWVRRLVVLCDQAPQTPFPVVQQVLEEELGRPFGDIFERFDDKPIGSASVAQVHRARVKGGKTDVAVKVQHPGAHELLMTDVRNLKALAGFIQRFDLNFDLMSIMEELEQQVEHEFDFKREADAMDRIGNSLDAANRRNCPIIVPRSVPGMVSRKVLVMDFVQGTPIIQLGEEMRKKGINPNGRVANSVKRNIMRDLSSAYGHMIIRDGFFQADPHPGNILINKKGKVALLDYGQTKEMSEELRLAYANMMLAIANKRSEEIGSAFRALGIKTSSEAGEDPKHIILLAQLLFDTKLPEGWTMANPFGEDSLLKHTKVEKLPKELFFMLRTAQLLRGLSIGMGTPFSCAEHWKPLAVETLRRKTSSPGYDDEVGRNSGEHSQRELVWERRRKLRKNGRLQTTSRLRNRRNFRAFRD